jgi:hypothetical protein
MVRYRAAGSVPAAAIKSEWLVELTNRFERHRPGWQMLGQVDEPINVPREKPRRRRAKVILLPHCRNGYRVLDLVLPNGEASGARGPLDLE